MKSISYYNTYPEKFIQGTIDANMSKHHNRFVKYIKKDGSILDLGCGSGRDSLFFHNNGYQVTSMDGALKMVEHCKTILSNPVIHNSFEDYIPDRQFDGIWACASLLHVDRNHLSNIIKKYIAMLKKNGIFFMSFKDRAADFEKDGRYFTCFDKKGLIEFIRQYENIQILEVTETIDVRTLTTDQRWVSIIVKKV